MNLDRISQDVLDALHDGFVVHDADGEIIYANPAAEQILGFTVSELIGLTSKDPRWDAVDVHGDALPDDEHPIVAARITGLPVRDFLMGVRRADGARAWVETNAMPMFDDDDDHSPIGAVAVFRDVTQELAARQALRTSEERFRTAVETLIDGFMIWRAVRDSNDRIVDFVCEFANAAVGDHGYSPNDLVGRRLLDVAPRMSEDFALYAAVVETGEPLRRRSRVRRTACHRGPFETSAVRMGDGIALTFRDITRSALTSELALRESEQQTRRFLEAMPLGSRDRGAGQHRLHQRADPADPRGHRHGRPWTLRSSSYFGLRRPARTSCTRSRSFRSPERSSRERRRPPTTSSSRRGGREIPVEGVRGAGARDSTRRGALGARRC